MIILDTNVISELMRVTPEPKVIDWLERQQASNLAITAIAIAEIQRGILRLPEGKKKIALQEGFRQFIASAFSGRVIPFDEGAALEYGVIAASREKAGFNTDAVDLMIVAIAKYHNASVATRNIKDFKGCDVAIINPWDM